MHVFNLAAVDGGVWPRSSSCRRCTCYCLKATGRRRSSRSPSMRRKTGARRRRARASPNTDSVSGLAQEFQPAIGQRRDVRGEAHVQRIDVKNGAAGVVQANHVAGTHTCPVLQDGLGAEFGESVPFPTRSRRNELPQPRKKSDEPRGHRSRIWKYAVDDLKLVPSPPAMDTKKPSAYAP